MANIIKILMERDGVTEEEAKAILQNTQEMIVDCGYDPIETEEIMVQELGLEMDYILDVI